MAPSPWAGRRAWASCPRRRHRACRAGRTNRRGPFEEDAQACSRIGTQWLVVFRASRGRSVLPRVSWSVKRRWVVVAANEATGLAEFQRQPAIVAGQAFAGVEIQRCAVFFVAGEEVFAQVSSSASITSKSAVPGFPRSACGSRSECAQHLFPRQPAARNIVQLLFQICREIVLDAPEEVRQERNDHPATLCGDEAPLVEAHVLAILQHRMVEA